MSRILIAEDEPRVSSLLEKGLRAAGYATMVCEDGVKAAAMASDEEFDLLILDLGLPGQDGFAVLRAVRARGEQLPVLILTARVEVTETVADLELGADDYVAKPFVFKELLARVRACLRRDGVREGDALVLEAGGVRLDVRSRRAETAGSEVDLSAKEAGLLGAFLRHPERGAQPRAAARAGLGPRQRLRVAPRRRLRRPPAPQARLRPFRDDGRPGLSTQCPLDACASSAARGPTLSDFAADPPAAGS